MNCTRRYLRTACAAALCAASAAATALGDHMAVRLLPTEGEPVTVGHVSFVPDGDGWRFEVALDGDGFVDKFLSMRPFRCLERPGVAVCHLAYPYAKGARVSRADLRDLEYALLFLHKTPEEYGINAWNGLYYRLEMTPGGIDGVLHEIDLNVLAAPPADGVTHPLTADMLHRAEPDTHWFPRLEIR